MTLPLRWPPDAARPLAPLRSTGANASASHPSSTNAARPAAPPAEAATPPLRTPKAAALSKNAAHILALMGHERSALRVAHGLPVAAIAEGFSAAFDGLRLFLGMDALRRS